MTSPVRPFPLTAPHNTPELTPVPMRQDSFLSHPIDSPPPGFEYHHRREVRQPSWPSNQFTSVFGPPRSAAEAHAINLHLDVRTNAFLSNIYLMTCSKMYIVSDDCFDDETERYMTELLGKLEGVLDLVKKLSKRMEDRGGR